MIQFSIGLSGNQPIDECITLARLAELYNFHTISVFDDLMSKPAWPILYVLAQQTQRIQLGPSVTNPYLIHPAILAENAALLDEISGGRAYLGVGRGAFLNCLNIPATKPITTVRELIELARRLWSGDTMPYHGQVFHATEMAAFHWQPLRPSIPIKVGSWGPKMCAMAGELADEIEVGSTWSVPYIHHIWEHVVAGAHAAGRDPDEIGLVLGPIVAISTDRARAVSYAQRTLASFLPYLAPMPEFVGLAQTDLDQIQAATAQGDYAAAASAIGQDVLDSFAIYGTPNEVITQIEHMMGKTNVRRIEFSITDGPDGSLAALNLLGQHVLPYFA